MQELFEAGDGFVNEATWKQRISELRTSDNLECGMITPNEMKTILVRAVKDRIPSGKFGLMLSGGVDSSTLALILKQAKADFICYTVGIEGANDLAWAKKVAASLGVEHKHKTLTLKEIHVLLKRLHSLYSMEPSLADENKAVLYGVACVELACIELAAQDGVTHFFGGIGSEEIFAGYKRHDDVANINAECWKGLENMFSRDLVRDIMLAVETGITVSTPFLDKAVISAAMRFDGTQKIKDGYKKWILRSIAEDLGLPHEFAWRKKQAAQYGSKFDKAIEKLTKMHGFQYKREYLDSL